ncbi:MAG TPA: HAD-IC family P-type ATPase [Dongiaceae bacterium]|nr:HAD-IC family P-type ATPase [Dongiaceae bacterium]
MLFYQQSPEVTLKELSSTREGISRHEAAQRLKQYGLNEITLQGDSVWKKLLEPFANVFMAVLFVAVVISFWHQSYLDAIIILVIMMVSAVIYYVQRFSTERILRSLQKRNNRTIEVTRGGESLSVDVSQLVPGDIVKLAEGDKVPADIRLLEADALRADEAVLTGESVPVEKSTDTLTSKKEIYDQTNMLFQGSFLIAGSATGIVVYTGNATEFGRIAALTGKAPDTTTSPVQKKIDRLIAYIIAAIAAVAVGAFILAIVRGIEVTEALRLVIALSVSAVPESLPVAISVILVLGMRRMAAKKALVRSMNAIETIGVITTIATDKTGTLTENILSVQETWQPEWSSHHLPTIVHRTINHHSEHTHDPLDVALISFTAAETAINLKGTAVAKLPFDQALAMSGNVWHHHGKHELVVKGAPEQVMMRSRLTRPEMSEVTKAVTQLTSQGYRVIALASTPLDEPLETFQEMHPKLKFDFAGLIAVADTIRPTARRAIAAAQSAGVTVRMITGDHFETALSIGMKLGLVESRDQVFDSRLMMDMTDRQLAKVTHTTRVFSRVTPENKFRILKVLKLKEVTAMTGDGVNDVPALANADVGVAMGSGSQIAKDAGDIILLNNDFASIVRAMREGRIVFSNIRRMLTYLLATNIGEVATTIGALFFGMPLPLTPIQILWINLVTDTTMVIPLGLEPGEKLVMRRKPINPKAPILGGYMISRIILMAILMAALALGLYTYYGSAYGTAYGQTIVFVALVAVQWANALNTRSTYDSLFTRVKVWHGPFWAGLAIAMIMQALALFGPLQAALDVHSIAFGDIFIATIIAFAVAIIPIEIHKFVGRKLLHKEKSIR